MPSGLSLGGAFFTLYGDNQDLLQKVAEAKAATKAATDAMAAAQLNYARASAATTAAEKQMYTQMAQQWVATAGVQAGALKSMTAGLDKYGISVKGAAKETEGFLSTLKGVGPTIATLAGLGAIASSALLVRESFLGLIDAAQQLNQVQFQLNKTFGDAAPIFTKNAEAIAAISGTSVTDALKAAAAFGSIQRNYALSTEQLTQLQQVAANAAAVKGVSMEEAAKRIEAALRGEAESIEYLGYSLQSNYLKALQDVNSEEYKHFNTLGQLQKTQIIYNELINQSNDFTGAAAERADSAAGAVDKMKGSFANLAATLGQETNPAVQAFSKITAGIVDPTDEAIKKTDEWDKAFEKMLRERPMPGWLSTLISIFGPGSDLFKTAIKSNQDLNRLVPVKPYGPTVEEADANAVIIAQNAKKRAIEDAGKRAQEIRAQEKEAFKEQIEGENRYYEAQKAALEKQKNDQIKASEDKKDAALAAIAAEKKASEDLYNTQRAHLEVLKNAELAAAAERHQERDRALAAEKSAVALAAEAAQRGLADTRDADIKAAKAREQVLLDELDTEQRAREHARTEEDRAIADETTRIKRDFDERKKAALAAIADEEKNARDSADRQLKAVEKQAKSADDRHRKRLEQLDAENKAAEKQYDGAVRAIADEQKAAEGKHTATLRQIDAEKQAVDDAHTSAVRALEDEQKAAQHTHDTLTRGLKDEQDAAEKAHQTIVRSLDDQLAKAQELHDQERAALDARRQAEDDRHRQAVSNAEDELNQQLAFLDATGQAADDQDKAAQQALKMAGLQDTLKKTRSGGNAADIAAAERAIQDELLGIERDAAKEQLKIKRDALIAAGKEAKEQEDNQHQLIDDQIKAEQDLSDARLAAADKVNKAQKQAADDELARVRDSVDARKQAADDELDRIKDSVDARKQAADDELARVKDVLDARKQASDDELATVKASLDVRKQALDDEKAKRQEVYDDAKTKADEEERRDKERLDKKKQRIQDDRDATLEGLKAKRDQTEKDFTAEGQRIDDDLEHAKRALADKRKDEDEKAADKKTAIERAAAAEQDQIKDTADAAIQASKDALEQYNRDADTRKTASDDLYGNDQKNIHATYDDPEDGLFAKLKKAFDDTKAWYDKRTTEVNNQYKNERDQIADTFDDKEHGLFAKIAAVHQKTVDGLKDTQKDWEENFKKPILEVTDKTFEAINKSFDALLKGRKIDVKAGDGSTGGGQDGGGGAGPPPGRSSNGQYRPIVDGANAGMTHWESGGTHGGYPAVDIFADKGSAIRAPVAGRMESATYPKGGNAGWLYGDDGLVYYFAHANRPMVDGRVDAGDQIGQVGQTGNAASTSPHLHFAIGHSDTIISARNGSGDIEGDSSYWEGGVGSAPALGEHSKLVRIEDGYLIFTLFGSEYRIKIPHIRGKGRAGAADADEQEVEDYIRSAAEKRGIDPDVALDIVDGEGGLKPMRVGKFDSGWSFWPFQEHYGGDGYEQYGYQAGLGNEFTKDTGWQPGDPEAWPASIDYALDYALDHGWGIWYGRSKHGIGKHEGLPGYKFGGLIPEPTLLVGQTLGPYAMAGESAPEWVTPMAPAAATPTQGGHQTLEMPIHIGNREVERLWIDGYHLNVQRGRSFSGFGRVG